ncbi:MAG: hypothetical protein KDJ15_02135 [Alphaproteobacteria bacterium]|nr:hypothetical protein [Alphaproteobacteria bacterium]
MPSFNVIDAAGNGYRTIWEERFYLLRLALVPVLIKLVCQITVIALGWEEHMFRQALVMLPSFFAEGWMVAHLVRLIYLGHRWPFRPSGDEARDMAMIAMRARGVIGGMLTFTVIRFLLAGLVGVFLMIEPSVMPPEIAEHPTHAELSVSGPAMLGGLFLLVASLWAFRLLWLYVPAAVDYPLGRFLRRLRGFSVSIHMLGAWMIAAVPVFFVMMSLLSILFGPYQPGTAPEGVQFLGACLVVVLDTVATLTTTAAIACGLKPFIVETSKKS